MDKLFDDIEREDTEFGDYSEPDFLYLNRIARPPMVESREILESWYAVYANEQPEEASRLRLEFRSTDPKVHYNALTELWVYRSLREQGYKISVHPVLTSGKKPDFLCLQDGTPQFFVEVTTLVSSPAYDRTRRVHNAILDIANTIDSAKFFISVSFKRIGEREPTSYKKLKQLLCKSIANLDYRKEKDRTNIKGYEPPRVSWEEAGWLIDFSFDPVPSRALTRNGGSGNVATISYPVRAIDLDEYLKNKTKEKLRYGQMDIPFILAINIIKESAYCNDEIQLSALLGRSSVTVTTYSDGRQATDWGRTNDGIWIHPRNGFQNKRVSAIWFIRGLTVFKPDSVGSKMWLHPAAYHALPEGFVPVVTMVPDMKVGRFIEKLPKS